VRDIIQPAGSDPELFRRLASEHRRFLEQWRPYFGPHQAEALQQQAAKRQFSEILWKPEGTSRVGLARLRDSPTGLRVHGIWTSPPGPESLAELLADIERVKAAPIATVSDVLPGVDSGEQDRFFRPKGFWHREKVLMRRPARAPGAKAPSSSQVRHIEKSDLRALVGVYEHAYSDRPGEFWTWSSPDPASDAEADVMSHCSPNGDWARDFLPNLSFVWESDGRVLGGALLSAIRPGVPYVEDLIVEPAFHRQGIGRALLERSILEVQNGGLRTIELAAIRFGPPARLYQSLGFEDVPPPDGTLDGHWVGGKDPIRA
jgi:GNAT superfamily N-acetyltransferase